MELQSYSPRKVDALLTNYEGFIRDLPEVTAEWPLMEKEEQSHHQVVFMEVWGKRRVLGQLYQTGQLAHTQEVRLASLDQLLLEQAPLLERCFAFTLIRLLTIFRWGTPLTDSPQLVRIETAATSLNQLAQALPVPA